MVVAVAVADEVEEPEAEALRLAHTASVVRVHGNKSRYGQIVQGTQEEVPVVNSLKEPAAHEVQTIEIEAAVRPP